MLNDAYIRVRMSSDLKLKLEQLAFSHDMTVSDYLRFMIRYEYEKSLLSLPDYDEFPIDV